MHPRLYGRVKQRLATQRQTESLRVVDQLLQLQIRDFTSIPFQLKKVMGYIFNVGHAHYDHCASALVSSGRPFTAP